MASDPICPRCSKPIVAGAFVYVEHGEISHLRCVNAEAVLRAAENQDRAQGLLQRSGAMVAQTQEQRRQRHRLARLTILIVEDHRDSREALHGLLDGLGARVLVAEHGAEALRLLDTETPDVVLCDVRMPGMSGLELGRRIRAIPQLARARLVAVSGFTERAAIETARAAGYDDFVAKPVEPETLIRACLRRTGGAATPNGHS